MIGLVPRGSGRIVGFGNDMVAIARIERSLRRFGRRFEERVLAPIEIAALPSTGVASHLAKVFAAKEACAKALGTGFSDGVRLVDIQVLPESGTSTISLHGRAAAVLAGLTTAERLPQLMLSMSARAGLAQAVVTIMEVPK
jgi:holo-[acyl-carrier protein] synthase